MKVPFRIKRVSEAKPAAALLVPSQDPAVLLRLCCRLRLIPPPEIYAVADGFLLRLQGSVREPPGVVRLREAGANLFLPVDAELIPALLPDEAASLGRDHGLVFLPEGRVLKFDPHSPLPLSAFLKPKHLLPSTWRALPPPCTLADVVTEISITLPDIQPDDILDEGGEGIGIEEPRPDDAPLPKKVLGKTSMGFGKALAWLGKVLHIKALTRAGGKAMNKGLSLFPRLGEKVFGKHLAGLRALLREFREGDVEKALRRALPLNRDLGRGADFAPADQLPTNDIRYSLRNILGGPDGGSFWLTEEELYWELEREYRRQAEAAVKRGDYRRAAFIYGKLLRDYGLAAAALSQGGLHHDAAVLHLKVLHDYLAAAREYELAGEMDQALGLYRQNKNHVAAGDLLRRIGQEELAIAEYRQAADLLVQTGHGHHQAGGLMLLKAQRPDLAMKYFKAGWAIRPQSSATTCAWRLAQLLADQGDKASLLTLVGEAEDFYRQTGQEAAAGEFFNEIARIGKRPSMADVCEELHDRALMSLAHKLHENAADNAPSLLSLMFPPAEWPGNLVSDADFALKDSHKRWRRQQPMAASSAPGLLIGTESQGSIPIVRAVFQASSSEEVFLGFENGEIACFHPVAGTVTYLETQPGPIQNLTLNRDGNLLVVLSRIPKPDLDTGNPWLHLACYSRGVSWKLAQSFNFDRGSGWVLPSQPGASRRLLGYLVGRQTLEWFGLPNLLPEEEIPLDKVPVLADFAPTVVMHLPVHQQEGLNHALLCLDGRDLCFFTGVDPPLIALRVNCPFPSLPVSSSLAAPFVSCLQLSQGTFEIAGLGEGGSLCWLKGTMHPNQLEHHVKSVPGPFLAATLAGAGRIIAIAHNAIVYLQATEGGIKEKCRQPWSASGTVACFVSHASQELILVGGNGSLSRVQLLR